MLNKMKTIEKTEYDIQAETFIKETNLTIKKIYTGHRFYFAGDKERRACFTIVIIRGNKSITFDFGNSIFDSYQIKNWDVKNNKIYRPLEQRDFTLKAVNEDLRRLSPGHYEILRESETAPSDYTILATMSNESQCPDTFEDFCSEYGCDLDSITARDNFLKILKVSSDIKRLFNDEELDLLREIC